MLYAAVQHAPRLGTEPESLKNEAEIGAMPGVHAVHRLPGAVAVTADSWWRARKAVEALQVDWSAGKASGLDTVAADFSSAGMLAALKASADPGHVAEAEGDVAGAFASAAKVVEADYEAPYLAHAQLEPPSAIARFNGDGTLDVWLPNQMPEVFQAVSAKVAGLEPAQVRIHSPMLGGFFGRHFTYEAGNPFPQAILLAKATGRPVKVLWSREEEFARDAVRPLSFSRFRAALDAAGRPTAVTVRTVGEGPIGRYFSMMMRTPVDPSAVEGIVEKPYAVPNRRMTFTKVAHPVNIAFWRSVGHSMNDAFYESFLDEVAQAGGQDPFALRMALLADSARHRALLTAVAEQPIEETFVESLPVAGVDGTLRNRMRDTDAADNLRGKTGSMTHVSALAGYVRTRDGEELAYAILLNGFSEGSFKDLEDRIGTRLAEFSRKEREEAE